jgi:hypothetical protein
VFDTLSRRSFLGGLASTALFAADDGWIQLFDGHSLSGWRPSENKNSWKVENGTLAADGPRSHLFYDGPVHGADFRNFELEVEVQTRPDCNSGVYFHTRYQEKDFPQKGFEVQINNTASGEGNYRERKKTASLYGLRNIYKQFVPDNEWFRLNIAVRGKNIQVRLNGMLTVDYTEPTPAVIPDGMERERFLDHGTFALQCHNDGSRAFYRSVRVRPLPDKIAAHETAPVVVDQTFRDIINIGRHNVPMVDYDVHLANGLTLPVALEKSRRDGIEYGVAMRVGSAKGDAGAKAWLKRMQHQPVFLALYAEGEEWSKTLSKETISSFDYVLADSLSWKDNRGRVVHLEKPQSVGTISDSQAFMDMVVDETVKVLERQPIDILACPTYLPPQIAKDRESLWTEARVQRVVAAAVKNKVALEINDRYRLPDAAFIRTAKAAGCKFSFGTRNAGLADLKRSEYGLQMLAECRLGWQDFFVPGIWAPRAVDRRS